jgi:hypothetical protein
MIAMMLKLGSCQSDNGYALYRIAPARASEHVLDV